MMSIDEAIINLSNDEEHDVKNKICFQAGHIDSELDHEEVYNYKTMGKENYLSLLEYDMLEKDKVLNSLLNAYNRVMKDLAYDFFTHQFPEEKQQADYDEEN